MDLFTALADSNRRQIIELLASRGQLSATEISSKFYISPPAISQHLKVLREAHLVQVEKQAQKRLYQINPKKILELEVWVKRMKLLWNDRFNNLDKLLKVESASWRRKDK